jgi:hypothetical protein
MYSLVFLIWSSLSVPAFAGIGQNVCDQLFSPQKDITAQESRGQNQRRSHYGLELLKLMGRISFAPSTMVKMQKIPNQLMVGVKESELKLAFINPKETILSLSESKSYQRYKLEQKRIQSELKDIGFRQSLRKLKDHSECLAYMQSDPLIEVKLLELEKLVEANQDLIKKQEEANTTKEIQAQEKFLLRENWQIIKGKNLNQIYSLIKELKPHTVLFLSHASVEGRLFDQDSNVIPVSFFKSLERDIHNLVLFNCYPEKVNGFYQFHELGQKINVYFPQVEAGVSLFLQDKTPVMALKSIKRISLESIEQSPQPKICTFSALKDLSENFSIFLNGIFLGPVSGAIEFDCSYLRQNNQLEIYATQKHTISEKPALASIHLNNQIEIPLREFISKTTNRHIVTKGSFNYQGVSDENP